MDLMRALGLQARCLPPPPLHLHRPPPRHLLLFHHLPPPPLPTSSSITSSSVALFLLLPLQPGTRYPEGSTARAKLRYGRLMLMTDQDEDGSHIKGLIISMLHRFWPELLEQRYLQDFNTPLIKARTRDGRQASFFDGREYAAVHPHPPLPPTQWGPSGSSPLPMGARSASA